MKRTCKQCGKEFELSESEISFYKSKGLELPKRCQTCRNHNKGISDRTQRTDKEQNSAGSNISAGGTSQNNRNNNGRKDKNYIAVAVAAALLFLAVFLVKNFLSADTERLLLSEDIEALSIQSGQEAANEMLSDVAGDPSDEVQQSLAGESEDKFQDEEQESPLPEESTDSGQSQYTAPQEDQTETQQDTQTEIISQAVSETSGKSYKFRKAQYLAEHFQKHGEEFPYSTEEEYLQGANNVIHNPDALHKLEAEDGDDVYYVESTNEFVVVSTDGFIRTYFKASMDYYNRQ